MTKAYTVERVGEGAKKYTLLKLASGVEPTVKMKFRGKSKLLPGFVYAPYTVIAPGTKLTLAQKKSVARHRGKWAKYREQHKACPKCGSTHITQTLVGYMNPPDLNRADCHDCKWRGTVDNLVPEKKP